MSLRLRSHVLLPLVTAIAVLIGAGSELLAVCGPFTDVALDGFCPFVQEIFYLGITTGTTPTAYAPDEPASRLQAAAYLSRTVDSVLKRGSRRAALGLFWTPQDGSALGLTSVGIYPARLRSDGSDIWVANHDANSVSRVRAADGKLLETWLGATYAYSVLVAMGFVFVTGGSLDGNLYRIDPSQTAGIVTTVSSTLGFFPSSIAFDGSRIWTANVEGSVSIVTPGGLIPWTGTTVLAGFSAPQGILFDSANIWVTDRSAGTLLKLDASGAILQTVTVGSSPDFPVFDGTNIWVPNYASNSVSVVRASNGAVLQTLTGYGLSGPSDAAFDGERVLVTNSLGSGVSLWKATNLAPLGFFSTGALTFPFGVCSDGLNFWITLNNKHQLARF